jgi:hypothetical protein
LPFVGIRYTVAENVQITIGGNKFASHVYYYFNKRNGYDSFVMRDRCVESCAITKTYGHLIIREEQETSFFGEEAGSIKYIWFRNERRQFKLGLQRNVSSPSFTIEENEECFEYSFIRWSPFGT